MREGEVLKLEFKFATGFKTGAAGEAQCDLCGDGFLLPEGGIGTTLFGFLMCPLCVACPKLAIEYADRAAYDEKRLEQWNEDPIAQRGIRKAYLSLASALRCVIKGHRIGEKSRMIKIPGWITARILGEASESLKAQRAGKVA